jgi:hypothetical protein
MDGPGDLVEAEVCGERDHRQDIHGPHKLLAECFVLEVVFQIISCRDIEIDIFLKTSFTPEVHKVNEQIYQTHRKGEWVKEYSPSPITTWFFCISAIFFRMFSLQLIASLLSKLDEQIIKCNSRGRQHMKTIQMEALGHLDIKVDAKLKAEGANAQESEHLEHCKWD